MSRALRGGVGIVSLAATLAVTGSCVTSAPTATPTATSLSSVVDAMFDDVMARYGLPGLALGIVRDDEVVYARTAGELVAGSGAAITSHSLFKIASNSKAMTTALLARLVDAGKLHWTDPVVKHLPQFRVHDPWITRQMQVRDLLIHNSGLRAGAGDLMFWPEPNAFTRADILAGLAYLQPQHSFRSRYDYDNLMYVVAGEVAAGAGGASYEELVRREVFEPLGLARCRVGAFRLAEVGDVAQPHMPSGEGNVVVRADEDLVPLNTPAAAGGIRCSLDDMLTWMRALLDPATRDLRTGTAWLSGAQREALWTIHMPMPLSERQRRWDGSRFNGYGYGWRISDVEGVLRIAHTGTLMGMYSAMVLLPERKIGFVLMTNGEGSRARVALSQALTMHFAAPTRAQGVAYYAAEMEREEAQAPPSQRALDVTARKRTPPGAMASQLGIYRDPWFGEVTLCARADHVEFASKKSPHMSGVIMDVGARRLIDWFEDSVDAEAWLDFPPSANAAAGATMTLSKVDPEADFSYDYEDLRFTRQGACP